MKNYIIQISTILIAGLALAACTNATKPEVTTPSTPAETTTTATPETDSTISLETIAEHATPEDCWFAIEGKVYDVSPYIASGNHPGDEAILLGCGKDATEIFNKRPNDGTSHSEKARSFLPNFYIGDLSQ